MQEEEQLLSTVNALSLAGSRTEYEEQRQLLAAQINELLDKSFDRLISWLYRLDINEARLRHLLQENTGKDSGLVIADLVIERQLQKLKSRKENKQPPPVDDEDSW